MDRADAGNNRSDFRVDKGVVGSGSLCVTVGTRRSNLDDSRKLQGFEHAGWDFRRGHDQQAIGSAKVLRIPDSHVIKERERLRCGWG